MIMKLFIESIDTQNDKTVRIFKLTDVSQITAPIDFTPTDHLGGSYGVLFSKTDCEEVEVLVNNNFEVTIPEQYKVINFPYFENDGEMKVISFRLDEMSSNYYSPNQPTPVAAVMAYIIETYFNERLYYELDYSNSKLIIRGYSSTTSGFEKDPMDITFPDAPLTGLNDDTLDFSSLVDVSTRVWHTCGIVPDTACYNAPSEWSKDITLDMIYLPSSVNRIGVILGNEDLGGNWNSYISFDNVTNGLEAFQFLKTNGVATPLDVREGSIPGSAQIRILPQYQSIGRYLDQTPKDTVYPFNEVGLLEDNRDDPNRVGSNAETLLYLPNLFAEPPVVRYCIA